MNRHITLFRITILIIFLVLLGCGGELDTYESDHELKLGSGLFSGKDGKFKVTLSLFTSEDKMSSSDSSKSMRQEESSRYRIRVHGHLAASWSDRLSDMVITRAYSKQKEPMTILVGQLVDQSALSGVLNTLHNLNLRLLSVENIDEHKDCT